MRVLIALDGSKEADSVLEALAPWLRRSATDVRLLMVMDASEVREAVSGGQPGFALTSQGSLRGAPLGVAQPEPHAAESHGQAPARAHAEREQVLRDLAGRWLDGITPRIEVVSSEHTAEAIGSYAEEIATDIVAVGTHGRSGLRRALMGSVAEQLVRTSPVPVLIVRSGMRTPATAEPLAAETGGDGWPRARLAAPFPCRPDRVGRLREARTLRSAWARATLRGPPRAARALVSVPAVHGSRTAGSARRLRPR